jgi:hypothetical protein
MRAGQLDPCFGGRQIGCRAGRCGQFGVPDTLGTVGVFGGHQRRHQWHLGSGEDVDIGSAANIQPRKSIRGHLVDGYVAGGAQHGDDVSFRACREIQQGEGVVDARVDVDEQAGPCRSGRGVVGVHTDILRHPALWWAAGRVEVTEGTLERIRDMQQKVRGYFTESDGSYIPTEYAESPWSADMLNGPCVCGLIARELENHHAAAGFVPARITVDLFKPVRNEALRFTTTRVRDGNRIRVADAQLLQGDDVSARATVVYLRTSSQPPGTVWTRDAHPTPPPADPDGAPTGFTKTWFGSDDHPEGWSQVRSEHQNASRKRLWARQFPVVVGEEASPFVRAVTVGEGTSLMTNWSDKGVGFINSDLTLTFSRLPVGSEVGVEADHHISSDGVSIGTSVLFDRLGTFGAGTVTALANAHRQVDFG